MTNTVCTLYIMLEYAIKNARVAVTFQRHILKCNARSTTRTVLYESFTRLSCAVRLS